MLILFNDVIRTTTRKSSIDRIVSIIITVVILIYLSYDTASDANHLLNLKKFEEDRKHVEVYFGNYENHRRKSSSGNIFIIQLESAIMYDFLECGHAL
jgi:hypothetical protein